MEIEMVHLHKLVLVYEGGLRSICCICCCFCGSEAFSQHVLHSALAEAGLLLAVTPS